MINTITNLIKYLPSKDVELGYKFLKDRNFEDLQYLVTSALLKTNKNIKSDNPKEEYMSVDLHNLNLLKAELDVYVTKLDLPIINDIYGKEEFWINE